MKTSNPLPPVWAPTIIDWSAATTHRGFLIAGKRSLAGQWQGFIVTILEPVEDGFEPFYDPRLDKSFPTLEDAYAVGRQCVDDYLTILWNDPHLDECERQRVMAYYSLIPGFSLPEVC